MTDDKAKGELIIRTARLITATCKLRPWREQTPLSFAQALADADFLKFPAQPQCSDCHDSGVCTVCRGEGDHDEQRCPAGCGDGTCSCAQPVPQEVPGVLVEGGGEFISIPVPPDDETVERMARAMARDAAPEGFPWNPNSVLASRYRRRARTAIRALAGEVDGDE